MSTEISGETVRRFAAAPRSAGAFTLYALACTLDQERAGCLFKLAKLWGLSSDERRLAYDLIELMIREENRGDGWRKARETKGQLIREG